MLVDLLAQQGISAEIQGEYLQGAIGDLPAGGLVRITVNEQDFASARQAIEKWEAIEPEPPPVSKKQPARHGLLKGLLLGLAWYWASAASTRPTKPRPPWMAQTTAAMARWMTSGLFHWQANP